MLGLLKTAGHRGALRGWRAGGLGWDLPIEGVPPTCPPLSRWRGAAPETLILARLGPAWTQLWVERTLPVDGLNLTFAATSPGPPFPPHPGWLYRLSWAAGCQGNQATKRMKKWHLGYQPELPQATGTGFPVLARDGRREPSGSQTGKQETGICVGYT